MFLARTPAPRSEYITCAWMDELVFCLFFHWPRNKAQSHFELNFSIYFFFFKIRIENLIFLWSQFHDSGPKAYLSDVSTTLQMLLTHFSTQFKNRQRSRYWEDKKWFTRGGIEFRSWSWYKYRGELCQGDRGSTKPCTAPVFCIAWVEGELHGFRFAVPGAETVWGETEQGA